MLYYKLEWRSDLPRLDVREVEADQHARPAAQAASPPSYDVHGSKKESKRTDFKERLDLSKAEDWCEIIKDIVAMANSGGGSILIGIKDDGTPSDWNPAGILALDPAQIVDKVAKYTGEQFAGFEIIAGEREGHQLAEIRISRAATPMVFVQPGTYEFAPGKQKTAFARGTVYFRHGAKSEPANSRDLREFVEREVERSRKAWLGNIRKVVKAPADSRVSVIPPTRQSQAAVSSAAAVRLVDDPSAPIYGKLDPDDTHPHRQKEVVEKLNARLPGGKRITPFDILCVRQVHMIDASKPQYYHRSKFSSPQYSDAFVDWLLDEFVKDGSFFENARADSRRARTLNP
jgi:hypothetical protein